ncbi:MAG TPA: isoprenylcysteine carboxylmethyltransferase family protein [Candidatus Angelobacter sp.]|nr:isoprenylcysteine carboxylmethyltransferase family protein [Candidatus Angelobacter sp.]
MTPCVIVQSNHTAAIFVTSYMEHMAGTYASYLWIALWTLWAISAFAAKSSVKRQSAESRLAQTVPVTLAFFLLFGRSIWPRWLLARFFPESNAALIWAGFALTALGVAFAILARLWIGRNWSGTVTIKNQHELVQNGPYRIVRHPIYTGLLMAYLGTALVHGEIRGLIGFLLLALGFGMKLRLEENFMVQQFGGVYLAYMQRVKAVVPYLL